MTDILAIDLATHAGWARGPVGDAPMFGSIAFAGTAGASDAAIMGNALAWLSAMLEPQPRPDILVLEALLPAAAKTGPDERARESIKAKNLPRDDGPLFAQSREATE